uniref:Uncharacterized protein n=1 Tax=Timema genevievae TaxID=629358 RepID=A0A7R9PM10_TIMGE|nr:unnamed protein product [Timema genevievae]
MSGLGFGQTDERASERSRARSLSLAASLENSRHKLPGKHCKQQSFLEFLHQSILIAVFT